MIIRNFLKKKRFNAFWNPYLTNYTFEEASFLITLYLLLIYNLIIFLFSLYDLITFNFSWFIIDVFFLVIWFVGYLFWLALKKNTFKI